jgi:hypothetical protein
MEPEAYFRVVDDFTISGRWLLQGLVDASGAPRDPRNFVYGQRVQEEYGLHIPSIVEGQPLEFTLADFDMPVVSSALGAVIADVASEHIQRLPITIEGVGSGYEILNVTTIVDALDRDHSRLTYWGESDKRPDKIGKPRMIVEIAIDPNRAFSTPIFRLRDWTIALIVSGVLARKLRSKSGIRLEKLRVG